MAISCGNNTLESAPVLLRDPPAENMPEKHTIDGKIGQHTMAPIITLIKGGFQPCEHESTKTNHQGTWQT
jgi:hypothetical protein